MAKANGSRGKGRPPDRRNRAVPRSVWRQCHAKGTPLDYLIGLMHDEDNDVRLRMEAAKAAAPYLHARLAQVQLELGGAVQLSKVERALIEAKPLKVVNA